MKGDKMPKSGSYHTYLIESLKDSKEADAYLNSALEDGSLEVISLALKNLIEAGYTELMPVCSNGDGNTVELRPHADDNTSLTYPPLPDFRQDPRTQTLPPSLPRGSSVRYRILPPSSDPLPDPPPSDPLSHPRETQT